MTRASLEEAYFRLRTDEFKKVALSGLHVDVVWEHNCEVCHPNPNLPPSLSPNPSSGPSHSLTP